MALEMTMSIAQESEYFDQVKSDLRRSFANKERFTHLGQPRLLVRLDRKFGHGTALVAYDFIVELYQMSGTKIHPLEITDGCIRMDLLADRTTDMRGSDLRERFLRDDRYHRLVRAFGVSHILFHWFPRVIESTNYEIEFYFDLSGRPIKS